MMKMAPLLKRPMLALPVTVCLLLAGCASRQYEVPLEDRSTELERNQPVVIRGGEQVPQTGTRRSARTTSSGTTTTASRGSAVVRGVELGGGIVRRGLDEVPLSASNESAGPRSASRTLSEPEAIAQRPSVHTVDRGETLYSIAWMYDMDYRRLAVANNLQPPYTIYPGQQLSLNQRDVSRSAVDSLPDIPASPAGGAEAGIGRSVQARRGGSVPTRAADGVRWQWPGEDAASGRYSSASRGIDIAGQVGDPVYAAADGEVVYAGRGIQGAGNLVILRHSARHLSAYMHNSRLLVSEGLTIRAGDQIAEVGSRPDGRPILHFEIRVDGQPVDPLRFLPDL